MGKRVYILDADKVDANITRFKKYLINKPGELPYGDGRKATEATAALSELEKIINEDVLAELNKPVPKGLPF